MSNTDVNLTDLARTISYLHQRLAFSTLKVARPGICFLELNAERKLIERDVRTMVVQACAFITHVIPMYMPGCIKIIIGYCDIDTDFDSYLKCILFK